MNYSGEEDDRSGDGGECVFECCKPV